jgi:maltose alpha-D-glucosyltransferase/alpha-amylase
LKAIRRFIDTINPECVMLCEANQWPQDVRDYFGDADEFQMAFHFPIMPRIFMALRQSDGSLIRIVLESTPSIPSEAQWCIFLRNHDELTLEMVSDEERQWMWNEYAPDPRMRLNLGIRRRLAPLLDNDLRKIEVANSLIFTLPGSPIIYYGDEIGMGDNIWLPDRDGLRTPMQWNSSASAGFTAGENLYAPVIQQDPYSAQTVNTEEQRANPLSLWNTIRKMIAAHKKHPALGLGELKWIDCKEDSVLAYFRSSEDENILAIHNLSQDLQPISIELDFGKQDLTDILTGQKFSIQKNLLILNLDPYQYLWLL